jgi:TIR domain
MPNTRFFISHVTTEAPVASLIAGWLEHAGAKPFVASEDISAGETWLQSLRSAIAQADIVLVLASQRSIERKWVWFEAGSAWASSDRRCIPVCFEDGFPKGALPQPLASLQAIDIDTDAGMQSLFGLAGAVCSLDDARIRRQELKAAVVESARINPRTDRTVGRPSGAGILIDISHAQDRWPRRHLLPNLLKQTEDLRSAFHIDDAITLDWIEHPEQIWRHDLSAWAGMVMALPNHTQFDRPVTQEVKAWVDGGGRLLLLGFELGDRHHRSNLNDLAELFGLRFNTDIVAPGPVGDGKPYDAAIDVELGNPKHPLLSGLSSIRVWNAQSVSAEPGGTPVITLDRLGVSRLRDDTAHYDENGWQTGGNQQFSTMPAPADRYLAAFAPVDLCGRGQVLALGTWDLRMGSAPADTHHFVSRLLTWLATGEAETERDD